jgi:RNA polymerase sigma-70 factor (ECF subfamily)
VDEQDGLAQRFEEHRTRLRAVAYRMLGSLSEADDAVQEAWLQLSRSDASTVENLGGWLTTVVGRVCLDMLRSRRSRREELLGDPIGARLPEPIVGRADRLDPEHEALLSDSVGLALLVVLETLSPAERLAFVLTICSLYPLRRSPHDGGDLRTRPRCSPAALGAGYREHP